jgi:hypothetical protein
MRVFLIREKGADIVRAINLLEFLHVLSLR